MQRHGLHDFVDVVVALDHLDFRLKSRIKLSVVLSRRGRNDGGVIPHLHRIIQGINAAVCLRLRRTSSPTQNDLLGAVGQVVVRVVRRAEFLHSLIDLIELDHFLHPVLPDAVLHFVVAINRVVKYFVLELEVFAAQTVVHRRLIAVRRRHVRIGPDQRATTRGGPLVIQLLGQLLFPQVLLQGAQVLRDYLLLVSASWKIPCLSATPS